MTTYGYDAIGEQTSVSLPDPATGLLCGPTTTCTYDALGRETSETDPPPPPGDSATRQRTPINSGKTAIRRTRPA